jgi:sterol desaturase/sphingolipid hydroxylase (fatty acid hydroxylase superfamily)
MDAATNTSACTSTTSGDSPSASKPKMIIRRTSSRQEEQRIQSLVLDAVTTATVLYLYYREPGIFNPWGLSLPHWLLGGLFIRGAIAFYDYFVILIVEKVFRGDKNLLPTRTTGKPVRYVELDTKSIVYLAINSVDEWIFVQRLCHFLWHSPDVSTRLQDISMLNTLVALAVMFIVLDVCYAPCHHILHKPWIYPLIHKHHHRQHYPTRGYLDAGNEHPIEHFIGIMSTWGAVLAATYGPTGAHAAVVFLFFNVHAALAMLNHSPYNVQFDIIPGLVSYKVSNHEMHHRKFTINYAQYCMWYDYVMNTYGDYEGPAVTDTKES